MRRRKVLVSAYACEPGKGSEPGAGWLWALAAARTSEVWVLTRTNNRRAIEADAASSDPSLHFVYVDLPRWARAWKRPGRGIRLYSSLWQLAASRVARRLHEREHFDVVHHVTFANLWLPALACAVEAPFLLGPVGGGQRVARAHYAALGPSGVAKERALLVARRIARINPLVTVAWRRAALILLNNRETAHELPVHTRARTELRPGGCVDGLVPAPPTAPGEPPTAVYAGRLHRFKGVHLAVRAVAELPHWRLRVAGGGSELASLRRLAGELGVEDRVEFLGRLEQPELWRQMREADAFLLPSFKEGGGMAVVEAAALGLPVVAFDGGGTAAVAEFYPEARFELVPPEQSYRGLAAALARFGKRTASEPRLDAGLDGLARDLDRFYRRVERRAARSGAMVATTHAGAER